MNEHIIIMAAGENERFGGVTKQFLDIGCDTILSRITRQVIARQMEPRSIMTHKPEVRQYALDRYFQAFAPMVRDTKASSLISSMNWFGERTIILLGDVIYSTAAMDSIMSFDGSIRFFGDRAEIYAVCFTRQGLADRLLRALIDAASMGRYRSLNGGNLRCVWQMLHGTWHDKRDPAEDVDHDFVIIDDFTRDIDNPYEYECALKEIVATGILEADRG